MSRLNINRGPVNATTAGGAPGHVGSYEDQLRRAVMSCMLWEGTFYESGVEIADRIEDLAGKVTPQFLGDLAIEVKEKGNLRHVPLLLAVLLLDDRWPITRNIRHVLPSEVIERVIQRPDELGEIIAIYRRKDPNLKLPAQLKRGIRRAFRKFNEYQLAKWDKPSAKYRLSTVLKLVHPKPKDEEQAAMWKRIFRGELSTPDTWEVALSAGCDKKAVFERLMIEDKLGALAFLRNLRNMTQAGVNLDTLRAYSRVVNLKGVLPHQVLAAGAAVPQLEEIIERVLFRLCADLPKFEGKTAILVDDSGSMQDLLSAKSQMSRRDAAAALAMILRELCEDPIIWAFGSNAELLPPRHGFALRDAIRNAGLLRNTDIVNAVTVAGRHSVYDRIVVITDEQQTHHASVLPKPVASCSKAYVMNVAPYRVGISYDRWTRLDGWSASLVEWMRDFERSAGTFED